MDLSKHTLYLLFFSLFAPSPEDLSEILAAGTKEVHEKAENTQFVKDFLRGRIRKELFKVSLEKIREKLVQLNFIECFTKQIRSVNKRTNHLNKKNKTGK